MPDANYLGDEEDLMPPLSEEDLLRMYGPTMAPPAVPAGYPGDEQDFHPSSAPVDAGDDEHESGPPIAPRGAGPASDPGFTSSIDWLKKLQGERPQLTQPKWWQRGLGAVAGGLAGYSNAAGRTRHPIDIEAMSDSILHPGYRSKLQEWQSKVVPAEAIAKLEGEKQAAWWKGRAANTEEAYKQAETARANQQGKMYENRANQERNRFSVDSKTGAIFDRVTGEVKTPPPTMAERKKMALEATGDEGMANFYAINGNLTGYGSTLATPKADHKPSNPAEVLMDPSATPEDKKKAQELFDKEHRAPREPRDPNAPKPMTSGQKIQIESRHRDRYAKLSRDVSTMLKNEPDNAAEIRNWEKQQKQEIEDAYASEIAAGTGNDITPFNYDAAPPAPKRGTGRASGKTVKVWDAKTSRFITQ